MSSNKIGIIDYNAGNLKSVQTAVKHVGADFFISQDVKELSKADKLIFPGVGDAAAAMQVLKQTGIGDFLKESFLKQKPIFGICLGTQIIFDRSEERNTDCLGLIPGIVRRFPETKGFKVPHMGWNQIRIKQDHFLFNGIPDNTSFYFVHSYYPDPVDKTMILSETDYISMFTSTVFNVNLVATQFHPEKSGEHGLKMLDNYINHKF